MARVAGCRRLPDPPARMMPLRFIHLPILLLGLQDGAYLGGRCVAEAPQHLVCPYPDVNSSAIWPKASPATLFNLPLCRPGFCKRTQDFASVCSASLSRVHQIEKAFTTYEIPRPRQAPDCPAASADKRQNAAAPPSEAAASVDGPGERPPIDRGCAA